MVLQATIKVLMILWGGGFQLLNKCDGYICVFPSAEPYAEEEEPRRKGILYEDLRLKNRENYEVMLSQKAETLHKPPPEKEARRPNKEGERLLLLSRGSTPVLADYLSPSLMLQSRTSTETPGKNDHRVLP